MRYAQGRGHLSGRRIPGIARPPIALVPAAAASNQLTNRRDPLGGGLGLGDGPLLNGGDYSAVISGNKAGIEHVFEYTRAADKPQNP